MGKFTLNYHTGAGNTEHDTIDEAMEAVNPTYTQESITIDDEDGNEVLCLEWCSLKWDGDGDEEEPHTDFGDFGYYGQWIER